MANNDFTILTNSLSAGTVRKGVTTGEAAPSGGGDFVYGFNSVDLVEGSVGLFVNQTNFAPIEGPSSAGGGSIRAVMKRGLSGGTAGFCPMVFIGYQGTTVTDSGYILSLSDAEPSHLVLKKGSINTGVADAVPIPASNGLLLRSIDSFVNNTYVHVRLDMIVNPNGDTILKVYTNDLDTNPLGTAPVWVPVGGMNMFVDDALAVNSGTVPFTSGYLGFGYWTNNVSRRVYFDNIEAIRQLPVV